MAHGGQGVVPKMSRATERRVMTQRAIHPVTLGTDARHSKFFKQTETQSRATLSHSQV